MYDAGVTVGFYFDFISPYSYLASQLIRRPEHADLDLDYRPVVFGTMLSKLDVKGPGEIPSRRRYGLQDVLLLCQLHGIPMEGPPTHPFNPIYALRSVCAVEDRALRGRLASRYFEAAWAEGRDLADLAVLEACLAELGIDQDPEAAATDRAMRAALKANTARLLELGSHGVPTFVADEVVFFGHDRLPLLHAFLEGRVRIDEGQLEALLARPQPGRVT